MDVLTAVRNFFDVNYEIVIFAYGLVFFVLGLAIALHSRRHSRLELAQSLGWLSIFGITHGFHEWGLIFIPVQAIYLNHTGVSLLQVFQVLLLGTSFAALFQFGATMVRERWPWLIWLPALATTGWLIWLLLYGLTTDAGVGLWQRQGSIFARYLLALPGGLLAAYGLRYQAEKQIRPLGLMQIYSVLRVAGVALAAYAFLAGLFVPAGDFFPANWLNESLLFSTIGVPVPVFRSLAGLVLTVSLIRAMEVFDLEIDQIIEQMALEQSLAIERERIGRELHDGAIQRAYTAGLIIESARRRLGDDDVVAQRLDRAMLALNEAIAGLRAYMTDLRAEPAALPLADALRQQVKDPGLGALLHVELELDLPEGATLDPAKSSHVLAIVGEALANAARHSGAQRARVCARRQEDQLVVQIEDDGVGFSERGPTGRGYGLRNMRDRARLLGGELTIESGPEGGACITLVAPWESDGERIGTSHTG